MAGLNQINRPLFSGDDRYKMAFFYLDRLFPYFPQYDNFDLYKVIGSSLKDQEYKEARDVQKEILDLLVNKLYYVERFKNTYMVFLTELGRTVKAAGGHENYINAKEIRLAEKEKSLRELLGPAVEEFFQQNKSQSILASNPNFFYPSSPAASQVDIEPFIVQKNKEDAPKNRVWAIIERINTLTGATNGVIQLVLYLSTAIGFILVAWNWKDLISAIARLISK